MTVSCINDQSLTTALAHDKEEYTLGSGITDAGSIGKACIHTAPDSAPGVGCDAGRWHIQHCYAITLILGHHTAYTILPHLGRNNTIWAGDGSGSDRRYRPG